MRSKRVMGTTVLIKADGDLVKKKTRSLLVRAGGSSFWLRKLSKYSIIRKNERNTETNSILRG